jgi:DNA-binding NtrC family response regulator
MCPAVLIIVITHVIDIQDPINAIRAGAFDYMLKPLDITLFQQRMQIAVDKVKYEYTKKKVKELLPSDLI